MSEAADSKIKVIVAMDFSDEIIEQLREVSPRLHIERHFPDVPESAWAEAEILYTGNRLPEPAQVPRLRWIQFHFAGLDQVINHPIVQAEDVDVTSASGVHATHMAEFCLAMMLAFMYRLPTMLELKAKAEWPQKAGQIFHPHGLRGLTLGIAGYGSIGRELARIAYQMGMRVLATKHELIRTADTEGYTEAGTGDPQAVIPERLYPAQALATMARECDFLVITAPLTPRTRHMVSDEVLAAMKPTAVLVNVSRGALVDEAALISALAAEKIGGAALDVFEEEPLLPTSPLWNLDHVIISPHVAGYNSRYHNKAAALFAENLRRYLDKRPLLNLLDRKRGY